MKKGSSSLLFIAFTFFSFVSLASENSKKGTDFFLDAASSELVHKGRPVDEKQIKEAKKFEFKVGFKQINGFIVSADRINQLLFSGIYRFADTWSFSLSQDLNHHYFLNPNSRDKGFRIQDTDLFVNKQFTDLPYESKLKLSFSSTLPLSHASRAIDTVTVSTAYLTWSLKLDPLVNLHSKWIKDIVFFVKPVTRYYFSRYTTTRTKGQSLGGTPLPEFLLGLEAIGLACTIRDYVSLKGAYGRWIVSPYKTKYKRDRHSFYNKYYKRHYYLFFLEGSVRIKKQWEASLSYSLIDRMDRDGRFEMVLFDDRLSTWAFSVSYFFAFDSI